jgi:predicted CoA-binding protein
MEDVSLRQFLMAAKTIAIIGFSSRVDRPGYFVAQYLASQGYQIIPVNPMLAGQVIKSFGECFLDLPSAVKATGLIIDIVDVFRKSGDTPDALMQALQVQARMIWLQLGIKNQDVANQAQRANMHVVMDRCLKTEHQRLIVG